MPITYAGSTASLSAQPANAPKPNKQSSKNLVSSSDGRLPKRRKNHGVTNGSTAMPAMLPTTKVPVFHVNGENIRPNTITVAISVMKHAASTTLPDSVRLNPNSNMTA